MLYLKQRILGASVHILNNNNENVLHVLAKNAQISAKDVKKSLKYMVRHC
ncbi:hypothetical protein Cyrtocomes_01145 [Candidatus Cyrtobacter comes]|uniref:Uncharacterized protein n=1 Tax=Candidatus Cyrtobacter comes TaxID=675776 RepID=A0ABU5L9E8_9RICK|nr:hypothetical protein [Candidatus Cyrtobacter comes]